MKYAAPSSRLSASLGGSAFPEAEPPLFEPRERALDGVSHRARGMTAALRLGGLFVTALFWAAVFDLALHTAHPVVFVGLSCVLVVCLLGALVVQDLGAYGDLIE